mgnify:CR=1 FL=1
MHNTRLVATNKPIHTPDYMFVLLTLHYTSQPLIVYHFLDSHLLISFTNSSDVHRHQETRYHVVARDHSGHFNQCSIAPK